MKKNVVFAFVLVLMAYATVSAFDFMGAVKNAAEDKVKETVIDAVTKQEPQEAPSPEKTKEMETEVEGATSGKNIEPEEKQKIQDQKATTAEAEEKSEPVKKPESKTVKSLKTSNEVPFKKTSIDMICVDDSEIVNFRKDNKTIATWIYKDDDTVEKKANQLRVG